MLFGNETTIWYIHKEAGRLYSLENGRLVTLREDGQEMYIPWSHLTVGTRDLCTRIGKELQEIAEGGLPSAGMLEEF